MEHGTLGKYTSGKCRCPLCQSANTKHMRRYRKGVRLREFVPADETREHLRFLVLNGWSLRLLAKHLGLSFLTLRTIAAGDRKRVERRTEEKILAAHTFDAPYLDRGVSGQHPNWDK